MGMEKAAGASTGASAVESTVPPSPPPHHPSTSHSVLGTPANAKRRVVFEGGHFLPRTNMVSETLGWLDHYLGPVTRP